MFTAEKFVLSRRIWVGLYPGLRSRLGRAQLMCFSNWLASLLSVSSLRILASIWPSSLFHRHQDTGLRGEGICPKSQWFGGRLRARIPGPWCAFLSPAKPCNSILFPVNWHSWELCVGGLQSQLPCWHLPSFWHWRFSSGKRQFSKCSYLLGVCHHLPLPQELWAAYKWAMRTGLRKPEGLGWACRVRLGLLIQQMFMELYIPSWRLLW